MGLLTFIANLFVIRSHYTDRHNMPIENNKTRVEESHQDNLDTSESIPKMVYKPCKTRHGKCITSRTGKKCIVCKGQGQKLQLNIYKHKAGLMPSQTKRYPLPDCDMDDRGGYDKGEDPDEDRNHEDESVEDKSPYTLKVDD